MQRFPSVLWAAALLGAAALSSPARTAAATPFYRAGDLAGICLEADNDARDGEEAAFECEQYLRGVLDALAADPALSGLCLPELDRLAKIRRHLTRWVYAHFDERDRSAAAVIREMLRSEFSCTR